MHYDNYYILQHIDDYISIIIIFIFLLLRISKN